MFKKRVHLLSQIDKLGIISFTSALGIAVIATIWSVYLESFLHNPAYVGFLTGILTTISIISGIVLVPVIEKNSKTKIFFISLIIYLLSYSAFIFIENIHAVILIGIIIAITSVLRITSFGIILRDKSRDNQVSRNIGLIYTFLNLSWLIGPIIAGFIVAKYGFKGVFSIGSIFILASISLFLIFRVKDNSISKKIDGKYFKIIKDFFRNKNRILSYIISGGITMWWGFIYIYIPLYIISKGLNEIWIGYFIAAVALPLILLEFYFGKLTARIGFRKIFFMGYLVLTIAAVSCFFLDNIFIILIILSLASIGAAMIEPTTEAYFFDIVSKKQREEFYGPYNTTIDLNHAVAGIFGALILLILPFEFLFLFFGGLMLIMTLISLKIRNIVEGRR